MSSIEQVYEKASKINAYNFENQAIHAFYNSKLDISKLEKSLSNINISVAESPPQLHAHDHHVSKIKQLIQRLKPKKITEERDDFSLYLFAPHNR